MSSFHIRPRFEQVCDCTPDVIQERIKNHLKSPGATCKGYFVTDFIVLKIPRNEQHFWSPQLSLTFEPHEEEGKTLIRGLYGPNPTVWALFTYGYAALGILALFAGMWGTSNLTLGKSASILWSLPVMAGIAFLMYVVAQTGQKIGAEQTFTLHHFYEEAMGNRVHIH